MPFFSNQFLPPVAKFGIFAALVFPIVPYAHNSLAELALASGRPITAPHFFALLLKEAAVGIVAGFATALVFRVPGMIGDFIDNQRGTSIAQVFNPAQGDQSSNLGAFLGQAFLVWFLIAGGLHTLLSLLYESFRLLPPATWVPAFDQVALEALVGIFAATLRLMAILAAPCGLCDAFGGFGTRACQSFCPPAECVFSGDADKVGGGTFCFGFVFCSVV